MASNLRIDVTVALLQGDLDSLADLVWLGLPGTETNGGDLVAGVEGVELPVEVLVAEIVQSDTRHLLGVLERHDGGRSR